MTEGLWTRRETLLAAGAASLFPTSLPGEERIMHSRAIPSSGEKIPVIGLGTYEVFDHSSTPDAIAQSREIVDILLGEGGSLLDTSPMYYRSEKVMGDIIDVHNLRDTNVHMNTIRDWQEQGRIRYNGLTHYTASAHRRLATAMQEHRPEFIQINYSLGEREADQRLLPLAADMGIAVLINRPYQAGRLFRAVSGKALPDWATGFAASWGQFFLKWIISHPAVTCAIPATSKPHHMIDNAEAGFGPLPDEATRQRMVRFMESL
jgi:aryl-alcohol dehydrogenase-like predicted oxidoreductase